MNNNTGNPHIIILILHTNTQYHLISLHITGENDLSIRYLYRQLKYQKQIMNTLYR